MTFDGLILLSNKIHPDQVTQEKVGPALLPLPGHGWKVDIGSAGQGDMRGGHQEVPGENSTLYLKKEILEMIVSSAPWKSLYLNVIPGKQWSSDDQERDILRAKVTQKINRMGKLP